jgi:hypothetical protein
MKKPQAKKPASKPKPEPSMATVAAAPANRPAPSAEERRYRAEDAMRTLQRAEEIKGDKGLMADVKAHAQKQVAVISKIAGKKPNAPDRPTRKPKAKPA